MAGPVAIHGIGPRQQAAMIARRLDPARIPGFEQRVAGG